jgi:hypothetical protein
LLKEASEGIAPYSHPVDAQKRPCHASAAEAGQRLSGAASCRTHRGSELATLSTPEDFHRAVGCLVTDYGSNAREVMTASFENRNTLVISEQDLDGGTWPCRRAEHALARCVIYNFRGNTFTWLWDAANSRSKTAAMRKSTSSHSAPGVRFARTVFWAAGAWGLVTLTPLYFAFDLC